MTPEERQLISDLFERMRGYDTPDKDRDAERLISQSVRANPDAPYLLVQSVLVQEQALQQADERIQVLEQRVRELEGPSARSGSGSFLGSARGVSGDSRSGSVPQVGTRSTPSPYAQAGASPWSQSQGAGAPPPAPSPSGGGGFMRTALSAAAGVAGGMLLADGIRGMLGGGSAHAGHGDRSGSGDSEAGYAKQHGYVDDDAEANRAQDAEQDAADDTDYDGGGGDMDI